MDLYIEGKGGGGGGGYKPQFTVCQLLTLFGAN